MQPSRDISCAETLNVGVAQLTHHRCPEEKCTLCPQGGSITHIFKNNNSVKVVLILKKNRKHEQKQCCTLALK